MTTRSGVVEGVERTNWSVSQCKACLVRYDSCIGDMCDSERVQVCGGCDDGERGEVRECKRVEGGD